MLETGARFFTLRYKWLSEISEIEISEIEIMRVDCMSWLKFFFFFFVHSLSIVDGDL